MNKRCAGVCFCFISAFLFATHYITTAIYLSNTKSWDKELFTAGLGYTGSILDILAIIALIIGLIYLFAADIKKMFFE